MRYCVISTWSLGGGVFLAGADCWSFWRRVLKGLRVGLVERLLGMAWVEEEDEGGVVFLDVFEGRFLMTGFPAAA